MIYSNKQYRVSDTERAKLKTALSVAEGLEADQQWLKDAEINALKSQIAEIEVELSEYKLLKSGQISFSKTYALEELPHVLVQARIAASMSQTRLAEKLDLKQQQIQRYEATDYMGASLSRLIEVSRALGVKSSGMFEGAEQTGGSIFAWGNADNIVWGQFPYREMIKRRWFDVPRNANPLEKVKEYFLRAGRSSICNIVPSKEDAQRKHAERVCTLGLAGAHLGTCTRPRSPRRAFRFQVG